MSVGHEIKEMATGDQARERVGNIASDHAPCARILDELCVSLGLGSDTRKDLALSSRVFAARFIEAFPEQALSIAPSGAATQDHVKTVEDHGADPFSLHQLGLVADSIGDAAASWSWGFSALAVLSAPDDPYYAARFAEDAHEAFGSKASFDCFRSAERRFYLAIKRGHEREDPAAAGALFWNLGVFYAKAIAKWKAELSVCERASYALLTRMIQIHQPDYTQLAQALADDGDRFGVTAHDWGTLGHPRILDLLSTYLRVPLSSLAVDRIEGARSEGLYPAGAVELAEEAQFGVANWRDSHARWAEGKVHLVPSIRGYIDTWKTGIWTRSGSFIEEVSHGPGALAYAAERLGFLDTRVHGLEEVAGTVAVVAKRSAWEWYAHWLTDVLPMLGMIRESGIQFDKLVAFRSGASYCKEGFEALGIPQSAIIDRETWIYFSAEQAVIPTGPRSMYGEPVTPRARDFVRSLFQADRPARSNNRRIYVSRRKAPTRRLLNEDVIAEFLSLKGFEIICLEDLSMRQKADVLGEADMVVGTYGAGMANVLFCDSCKVLEIRPPGANWWIQSICNALGHRYAYVGGSSPTGVTMAGVYDDFVVDPAEMKAALSHFRV